MEVSIKLTVQPQSEATHSQIGDNCPFYKCTWSGTSDQFKEHIRCCEYRMVHCTNNGCKEQVIVKDLKRHVNYDCRFSLFQGKAAEQIDDTSDNIKISKECEDDKEKRQYPKSFTEPDATTAIDVLESEVDRLVRDILQLGQFRLEEEERTAIENGCIESVKIFRKIFWKLRMLRLE